MSGEPTPTNRRAQNRVVQQKTSSVLSPGTTPWHRNIHSHSSSSDAQLSAPSFRPPTRSATPIQTPTQTQTLVPSAPPTPPTEDYDAGGVGGSSAPPAAAGRLSVDLDIPVDNNSDDDHVVPRSDQPIELTTLQGGNEENNNNGHAKQSIDGTKDKINTNNNKNNLQESQPQTQLQASVPSTKQQEPQKGEEDAEGENENAVDDQMEKERLKLEEKRERAKIMADQKKQQAKDKYNLEICKQYFVVGCFGLPIVHFFTVIYFYPEWNGEDRNFHIQRYIWLSLIVGVVQMFVWILWFVVYQIQDMEKWSILSTRGYIIGRYV